MSSEDATATTIIEVHDDGRGKSYYEDIKMENAKFEEYLKQMLPEEEVQQCLEGFKQALPATFRLLRHDCEFDRQMEAVKALGVTITQLGFCPNAWQLSLGRREVRKNEALSSFHKWLVDACESGQMVRQEAVSMIPPLLLQVQGGQKVLDMCAAPGSKTSQLVENVEVQGPSDSLVFANDADRNRAYMLYHQVRRLCSPSLLVAQFDASRFPQFLGPFDRVLCDVPCSGDGTLRKNKQLWREWDPRSGIGLHALQRRIFQRGIDLLTPGGRIVYSTCSLNPVENESVVASILQDNPFLSLVDCSSLLPELKRASGLTSWKVAAPDACCFFDSHSQVPEQWREKLKPSMFSDKIAEDIRQVLPRCLRIYPHLQDSGGFFVAVFEKAASKSATCISPEPVKPPVNKKVKTGEEPLAPIPQELLSQLQSQFFKTNPPGVFITRSATGRNINYVNPSVAASIEGIHAARLVNAGLAAFERYTGHTDASFTPYRLVGEGLKTILPFLKDELIIDIEDCKWLSELISSEQSRPLPDIALPDWDPKTVGSYVFHHPSSNMLIPVWTSGNRKFRAFVPKLERPFVTNSLLSQKN